MALTQCLRNMYTSGPDGLKLTMEILHEGWLVKSPPHKGLWKAKWRRRWFVLRQSGELPGQFVLEYYADNHYKKLKGSIDLDQCEQVDAGFTFENRKSKCEHMFDIKTPKRVYYLSADTEEEMNKWVNCICQVCGLKLFTHGQDCYFHLNQGNSNENIDPRRSNSPLVSLSTPYAVEQCSPSISTEAYIAISDCISGTKPVFFDDDFDNLKLSSSLFPGTSNPQSSHSLLPESPSLYTPTTPNTDADSVFTNDEWSGCATLNMKQSTRDSTNSDGQKHSVSSDTPILDKPAKVRSENAIISYTSKLSAMFNLRSPPRPPKPPCMLSEVNHSYHNLEKKGLEMTSPVSVYRKVHDCKQPQIACFIVPSSPATEISSSDASPITPLSLTSEGYNSHSVEISVARSHSLGKHPNCTYSNAIHPTHQVFTYDFKTNIEIKPNNGYCNVPLAPNISPDIPPVVNRKLKPKGKTTESEVSPCVSESYKPDFNFESFPPTVDRKLKPDRRSVELFGRTAFPLDPPPLGNGKRRAAPSPSPPYEAHNSDDESLGNPAREEEVYVPFQANKPFTGKKQEEIQYLDLDLESDTVTQSPPLDRALSSSTVYKTVDFIKTEAFNMTRQSVEETYRKCQE